jgi:ABC-type multidrug transport system ATPase subunit
MTLALETSWLTKRFGRQPPAVDSVSLHVPRRAIYGFLGANGAGKTTTLRLILGLLRPDAGEIRLFGREGRDHRAGTVGALIETPSLYPHLTGRENLDLSRRLLRLPRTEIDRVLEIVDLAYAGGRKAGAYSLGMRQRLGVARALLGNPRLLVLDEPTNGLDPDGIRDMRALLRRLPEAGDATLIVSSHLLTEVEQVATHVGLLHRGRLLVESPLDLLLGGTAAVEVATADRSAAALLLAKAGFDVAADEEGPLLVEGGGRGPADPAEIAALLVREGHSLTHLARHRPSLERIYHHHIAEAA